ncbi:thioester domain-containing protein [Kibdelosporangium persicum]|uniref:LPXTG-motif cell wall anchor domain-containing protein/TQXA domain-containing protein n=1 Tax=Kibdelosporangium persicum TaxID=2698649 RepID=A0ABX2F529_9PSEU|nr:thioester domain-containing protein [Kibdelosporangium persicum]NRN66352.1 LPXTG-motif cell wall anchor domain-containing protein/TQXA domain-containing protein [Kibdelosporangium persicum]
MSRVKKLRVGAALVGVTATALLASVTPAAAEAARGKIVNPTEAEKTAGQGYQIELTNGPEDKRKFDTSLFVLEVGDKRLRTYCVDIYTSIKPGAEYEEAAWNEHPKQGTSFKKNSAKINWILHNGYPELSAEAMAKKIGGEFDGGLNVAEAVTATQAAIWHFSDDAQLKLDAPTPKNPEAKNDVVKVYKYLIGEANVGISAAPKPVLTLEPTKLSGKPDSLIGPFVVTTTAAGIAITAKLPEGVIFSDKDGKELPKADVAAKIQSLDKYEFYVKVPASVTTGKVEFTVAGESEFSLGRLFVALGKKGARADSHLASQSMILASSEKVRLEAKGSADWAVATAPSTEQAPQPQPKNTDNELANTGASVLTPLIIGVVLVGGGVGALIFQRRRRRA